MDKIREMLDAEIESRLEKLDDLIPGSKEAQSAVSELDTLYKLRLEEIRTESEFDEKYAQRVIEKEHYEREEELKKEELKGSVKERYIRIGVDAAAILLPIAFYGLWMKKGFEFEKEGTFTSTTFRGLFNRFRPTK